MFSLPLIPHLPTQLNILSLKKNKIEKKEENQNQPKTNQQTNTKIVKKKKKKMPKGEINKAKISHVEKEPMKFILCWLTTGRLWACLGSFSVPCTLPPCPHTCAHAGREASCPQKPVLHPRPHIRRQTVGRSLGGSGEEGMAGFDTKVC